MHLQKAVSLRHIELQPCYKVYRLPFLFDRVHKSLKAFKIQDPEHHKILNVASFCTGKNVIPTVALQSCPTMRTYEIE